MFSPELRPTPERINLALLPSLRDLELTLNFLREDDEVPRILPNLLDNASTNNQLQSISLTIDLMGDDLKVETICRDEQWERLDGILSEDRFSQLTKIVIQLDQCAIMGERDVGANVPALLEDNMPGIHSRGILSVSYNE